MGPKFNRSLGPFSRRRSISNLAPSPALLFYDAVDSVALSEPFLLGQIEMFDIARQSNKGNTISESDTSQECFHRGSTGLQNLRSQACLSEHR